MRLDINKDTQEKCVQYDVFFNGVKQSLCVVADEEKGYIERYKFGIGRRPLKGRFGRIGTIKLHGKVEIRRKVNESKHVGIDVDSTARGKGPGAESDNSTDADRSSCSETTVEDAPTQ
jgi:hypothetical protein